MSWAYCRAVAQLLQVHRHAFTADSCYSRLCRSNGREDSSRDRERDRDRDRARDRERDRDIERERERELARRDDRHRSDRCRHRTLHFVSPPEFLGLQCMRLMSTIADPQRQQLRPGPGAVAGLRRSARPRQVRHPPTPPAGHKRWRCVQGSELQHMGTRTPCS